MWKHIPLVPVAKTNPAFESPQIVDDGVSVADHLACHLIGEHSVAVHTLCSGCGGNVADEVDAEEGIPGSRGALWCSSCTMYCVECVYCQSPLRGGAVETNSMHCPHTRLHRYQYPLNAASQASLLSPTTSSSHPKLSAQCPQFAIVRPIVLLWCGPTILFCAIP